ncbi:Palmitoyltransferase [Blyttiomyces sp. JEL0837]|nr:Palmitoyltransferase [Blyttiomyces sp. JEL0837]
MLLFCSGFASLYCLLLLAWRLLDLIRYQDDYSNHLPHPGYYYTPPATNEELLAMVINVIVLFILLVTVGLLSVWQIFYVSANTTTIENLENTKIEELVRRKKIPKAAQYPYDLGFWGNMKSVLGERVWLWWMPQGAVGDGIHFPVNPELAVPGAGSVTWPPAEYYEYNKGRSYGVGDDDVDELESEEEEEDADVSDHQHHHGSGYDHHSSRRLVRRGSEGYLVKMLTAEDRERMVEEAMVRAEARAGLEGTEGAGDDLNFDESDDEVLFDKQRRYEQLGLMADSGSPARGVNGADGEDRDGVKAEQTLRRRA